MSRTFRSGSVNSRDGQRRESFLRRADRYVGYADEGIWNPESRKRNKAKVTRENRRKLNRIDMGNFE